MSKLLPTLGLLAALVAGAGCNKPSEDDCRKALSNMQTLMGTEYVSLNNDIQGEVRRCRGGSSNKAVECAANAKTLDELKACDFMKVPDKKK